MTPSVAVSCPMDAGNVRDDEYPDRLGDLVLGLRSFFVGYLRKPNFRRMVTKCHGEANRLGVLRVGKWVLLLLLT